MILGIDEVGRGPWAGPLVVGAVVFSGDIEGLTDSKKLTTKKREALSIEICKNDGAVALGWVSPSEIDSIGLSSALKLATKRAVKQIRRPFSEIVIDGTVNFLAGTPLEKHVTLMKKADLLVPSVSAAAVVAKVARDKYMSHQDDLYPGYGFSGHVGYGTAKHRLAIESMGVTPLHRLSFAPLKKYANETQPENDKMSSVAIGNKAEEAAATHLEAQGHAVIARNWRTKMCEIDIVSLHADTVYFTEVKYRKTASHGDGFEAITPKKLKQMRFAAEVYMRLHGVEKPAMLSSVSVSGDFQVDGWVRVD